MAQREADVEGSTVCRVWCRGWVARAGSVSLWWYVFGCAGVMLTPIDLSVVWENSMGMWEGPASTTLDRSVGGSGAARCRERCRESRGFKASTHLYIRLALSHGLVEALHLYTPLHHLYRAVILVA